MGVVTSILRAAARSRGCGMAAMLCAGASLAAAADRLPISGAYGNAEGCRLAKTGEAENDTLLLLKPDWIQSYGTGCDILQALPGKEGAYLIYGICGFEGEDGLGARMMVISKVPEDAAALRIHDQDGTLWGDVRPCS